METEKNIFSGIKNKKSILITGIAVIATILLITIFYNVGVSNAKVELENEKVKYEDIVSKIKAKEVDLEGINKEVEKASKELDKVNNQYKEKAELFKEAQAVLDKKDSLEKDLETLQSSIDAKSSRISDLEKQISDKNNELASVEGKIKVAKDDPKNLPAGMFVVGKDIPPGRYKVVAVGRGSNFFVFNSDGSNLVNTIISNTANHGVPEYVTYLAEGYIIEANSPFKYIPIE